MRTFEKSTKLHRVRYDVRGSVNAEADQMAKQGVAVLKLNIGNPALFGFKAPGHIKEDMMASLENAVAYSDSKGLPSARAAIAAYCSLKDIPGVGPDDVYTGNGVSEMIVMAMQALLNPGDEILVPSPDYPLWTAAVTLSGGTAVHYICDEQSDWNPDISDMRRKITARTKGVVVINPNNPTGALYPKDLLEQIAALAREHDLILFADEIYDRLIMDGCRHTSIASLAPDLFVVTMNGLSKSHNICGFRCGWMCLSGDRSRVGSYIEGLNLLSSMRLCSNVTSQIVIERALQTTGAPDPVLLPGGRLYEQRNYIFEALNSIPGVSAVKPKAALYIFPRIDAKRFRIHDDEKFALDFLRDKHILVVHGSGFNWHEPDHFRIVYLPEVSELKRTMDALGDFLGYYRQS
jgi:alanine-synthesizing transaminase